MKICIVGAGAIGGFIGVRLARAGVDLSVVARGATAAALRRTGWRLALNGELAAEGTVAVPVRVAEAPEELGVQDLVIVAVKAPALAEVAVRIAPLLGPETMVMTAMNGVPWWFFEGLPGAWTGQRLRSVDPDGRIAAAIAAPRIIGCIVHATCATPEPGLVRHGFGNELIVGEPQGGSSERLERIADLLRHAGFAVTISQRIQADIWYKLWGNMTMNPVSALTQATTDRILDDKLLDAFCLRIMGEAAAIGAALGCPIAQSGEDRNAVTRKLGRFKTSMLQDVEAGKKLEIDALLSVVCEIGALVGVPTPNTDALLGLTRVFARNRGLYKQP